MESQMAEDDQKLYEVLGGALMGQSLQPKSRCTLVRRQQRGYRSTAQTIDSWSVLYIAELDGSRFSRPVRTMGLAHFREINGPLKIIQVECKSVERNERVRTILDHLLETLIARGSCC